MNKLAGKKRRICNHATRIPSPGTSRGGGSMLLKKKERGKPLLTALLQEEHKYLISEESRIKNIQRKNKLNLKKWFFFGRKFECNIPN